MPRPLHVSFRVCSYLDATTRARANLGTRLGRSAILTISFSCTARSCSTCVRRALHPVCQHGSGTRWQRPKGPQRLMRCQTSSGLKVVIISADLRWTSASRSKFFGNLLRLAWINAFFAWDSCQVRAAVRAASHPCRNSGVISVTRSVIGGSCSFRTGTLSYRNRSRQPGFHHST